MRKDILLLLKGAAMGAANVIPGVSGGTIAFITGIYEELIFTIKSFNLKALQLLAGFRFQAFFAHINLRFLIALFAGIGISIVSLGKLLKFLFESYPVHIWAFFFGLIMASVYFVGKIVEKWNTATIFSLLIGTGIAVSLAFFKPADENEAMFYLFLCGVAAAASMILPGLSGSFVLILMGNYELIFLEAVPEFDMKIVLPVVAGAAIGIVILSQLIGYILEHYQNPTLAMLAGFILGSLLIIWPWKDPVYLHNEQGKVVVKDGEKVISSYERFMPDPANPETWLAAGFMILGILAVWYIEKSAKK